VQTRVAAGSGYHPTVPVPMTNDGRDNVAYPVLSASQVAEMAPFGAERSVVAGDFLFQAGEETYDLFVVLEGGVEVVRADGKDGLGVPPYGPGDFVGELTLLTGQHRFTTARVTQSGRILVIGKPEFRRLMSDRPALAETIFSALVARREILRSGQGNQAIRIIGSKYSPEAMDLRSFADHSRLAYTWIDTEDADDVDALLRTMGIHPQDTPVVITPTEILRRPSTATFAEHLGLTFHPAPGYVFDLVVVGSGPAGLSAAVYGASEGLRTVCLDAVATGGQAGASSRIENYAGFPNGVSGGDLTAKAALQAMRLGARLNAPSEVVGLRTEAAFHVVVLRDGSEIPTRTVIVASGARYRRLDVKDLTRFEGAGVFYAATALEARVCAGKPVVVVGGGNSAGQAALYLAQHECEVTVAIRRADLTTNMSEYLIARIAADPRIDVLSGVQVQALDGDDHLEQVTLSHTATGRLQTISCSSLFCFIGADPETAWLGATLELDRNGFVFTDRELPTLRAAAGSRFLPFETSTPGVFAAGDVRHDSMKRVAAAVGEGSGAVQSVHERLAANT
jgi:thioredoxin reductase (NADPH)